MTDPRLTELLNGEIDGELDRQQRAELSRRLLANTGARAAREDLRRVCEALDSVPQVEPPPALSENVLQRALTEKKQSFMMIRLYSAHPIPSARGFVEVSRAHCTSRGIDQVAQRLCLGGHAHSAFFGTTDRNFAFLTQGFARSLRPRPMLPG